MKWIASTIALAVLAALALSPARADPLKAFQPAYDLLSISNSAPGGNGSVSQRITVPGGDHAIGYLMFTLPPGWDIRKVQSGSSEPIVGTGQLKLDVDLSDIGGTPCDGNLETYNLTIYDLGSRDVPAGAETEWLVQGYAYEQLTFIVKGSAATGQIIEAYVFLSPTPRICTPMTIDLTFLGVSADNPETGGNEAGATVLVNPGTAGVYSWSLLLQSKPLSFPPAHQALRCDQVGIGAVAPDTDLDGIADGCDNCPATANAGQRDIDGDGLGDVCDGGDTDGDGFSDRVETSTGTDLLDPCADHQLDNANPADLNNDTFFTSTDMSVIAAQQGFASPPAPGRNDIAPDPPDGFIAVADLSAIAARIGQSCT